MSLFGSLFTGVTGLAAQSRSMGMISDNVANVSTTAYKRAQAQFATMVVREAGSRTHRPGGVTAQAFYTIANQGPITATSSPTDVAIVGSGFFVVRQGETEGEVLFTRAGDFETDAFGNLRTPSGFYVQGWRLDRNGAIVDPSRLETVNIQTGNGIAMPTTEVALGANLDADQPPHTGAYAAGDMAAYLATGTGVQPHFTRTVEIFDSLGRAHQLTFAFLKSNAPNSWFLEIVADDAEVEAASHPNGIVASGTVVFAGDGSLAALALAPAVAGANGARIDWLAASGADPSDIVFDLGTIGAIDGLTQFASPTSVAFVSQNGAEVGRLASIAITEEGYLVASFTNGQRQRLYRLALATFPNPAGLDPRTGNVYAATDRAGEPILRGPGESGAGRLIPSALEASNVDLADEFTKMIVTQRAYSANARVISTTDEMLDELVRLRR
ncbi:MAG: flagellar hook protein FlgE [Geminicoccaceae bacterium]|nr:flagellar hook protein FlgE [Geminicoccaceae bacterium]MDW8340487.1 flagellar hook protein FlgE [Geminicoccaceae bacterium]